MRTLLLCSILAGPAAAQTVPEWELRPVAAIGGSRANDDRYTFDRVTPEAVVGRADGHVLLLDVQGRRILEYDERGRHVSTFGRAGEGPGEFRFPAAIALGTADSLWVFDVARITVFPRAAGGPRTLAAGTRMFGLARVTKDGFLRGLADVPGASGGSGSLVPERMRVVRFDAGARARDTLRDGPLPRRVLLTVRNGNSTISTHATEQYGLTTHWDLLRDGTLVVADTTAYLLRFVSPDGTVTGTFGTREPARPLTSADRDQALERIRRALEARAERMQPVLERRILEETPFAEVMPRIAGVRVDGQDRIWVGVNGVGGQVERIDVHERSGRLVARINRPPGMPVAVYGDGMVAFLERDEFDAQSLRLMRIQP